MQEQFSVVISGLHSHVTAITFVLINTSTSRFHRFLFLMLFLLIL